MHNYKIIAPNKKELCYNAADELLKYANQTIDECGEFSIALTGGSTPKDLYELLANPTYSKLIPWGKMQVFFGDERTVPADHPDSNYKMASDALLDHINIDPLRVHRIQAELPPEQAANNYDDLLSVMLPKSDDNVAQFDLVLLGLGPDGHIASLFPETDILEVNDYFVAPVWVEKLNTWRISITYPVINHARQIWLFVSGESKQAIIDRIFNHPSKTNPLPVEKIAPKGDMIWFLDADAAKLIK